MKKMRVLSLAMTAALSVSLLAGCGGTESGGSTGSNGCRHQDRRHRPCHRLCRRVWHGYQAGR